MQLTSRNIPFFKFVFLNCLVSPYHCSNVVFPVCTVLSSFVGTLKNEILGAALELCQLKIEHFSPGILKFRTTHENNPFTLNCSMVPRTVLFIFHAGSRGLGSENFRNSSYKEKTAGSARVSRLSFRFL